MDEILSIDPGTTESAWLLWSDGRPTRFGIGNNHDVLLCMRDLSLPARRLVIEGVECFGMPVGRETFDTCIWIGRFIEGFGDDWAVVYRSAIKLHLCRSTRAKDPMIRQALIDRFGPGKDAAIGRKSTPGPLYGISSHCWSALALAVYWSDTQSGKDSHARAVSEEG